MELLIKLGILTNGNDLEKMDREIAVGYKQTEVGVIPKDWTVKPIEKIALVYRGASPRPIDDPIWFDDKSSVGWVRISDVSQPIISVFVKYSF